MLTGPEEEEGEEEEEEEEEEEIQVLIINDWANLLKWIMPILLNAFVKKWICKCRESEVFSCLNLHQDESFKTTWVQTYMRNVRIILLVFAFAD
jgi:hypothetical protein